MQIVVEQLLTSYAEIGSGKKILLFLHGWADSGRTFEGLSRELVKNNSEFKIILLDLPGFGGTAYPSVPWGLDEYAGFVAAFLQKAKLKPYVIIGHSNGGAIAIRGLAGGTLQADKLVLLASAGIRKPSLKKGALRVLAKPAALILKAAPQATQERVRRKLYSAIGSDYLVAVHMQDTFKRVVSTDVQEDARKLKLPVCLIYGELDDATPAEFGKSLAGIIPNSTFHLLPQTGHFLHHEQVYQTADLIKEFSR